MDDHQTCLVGKNESGKTALLEALYKTNPVVDSHVGFEAVVDYPKREVSTYMEEVDTGIRDPAVVVRCKYELERDDIARIERVFGAGVVVSNCLTRKVLYAKDDESDEFELDLSEEKALKFLSRKLSNPKVSSWDELDSELMELGDAVGAEELEEILAEVQEDGFFSYIVTKLVWPYAPKFMYFDEYFQMRGGENLQALIDRESNGETLSSDLPLLGLMRLARMEPEHLLNISSTEELRNRLDGASSHITRNIVKYWSQNSHLEVVFEVQPGRPGDPEHLRDSSANICALVRDKVRYSKTEIDKRSRGFVWFFSFLAWYGYIRRQDGDNIILLLDEPGLSLHGKAQNDLLRYFTEELSAHQIVYSTHSPFMLDLEKHKERVRVVQDKGIDAPEELSKEADGTKVLNNLDDVWADANADTLFPLFAAMGIEMWQMGYMGKNLLVVEGQSDREYLETMSMLLEKEDRVGLSRRWGIVHAGGKGRVSPIVAILSASKGMNVAVLLDVDTENEGKIENLYRKKLVKKDNVVKVSDFVDNAVGDIEDLFGRDFYVQLVNATYKGEVDELELNVLSANPRVVKAVEKAWPPRRRFSHLRPARYLALNAATFGGDVSDRAKDRFESMFKKMNELLRD